MPQALDRPLDLLLVCFLGVIWVAIDSRHQGWHDKLVNTYVVRV
ncbi:MAG: RDD family protein [Chloroflexi bacterium]|nr:MAG: RDD family protein [Chloroflexota bacterium]